MDGAQPHVAGTHPIFSTSFEALEKRGNHFNIKLFNGQPAGITILPGSMLQEQFKTVAIALEGMGA
jgi:hypothetical protein